MRHRLLHAISWALAASACVEVPSGTECLVVTELSSVRPGPVAFSTSDCQPIGPCGSGIVEDPDWYCPDWVELCNFSGQDVDLGAYRASNHLADDPSPFDAPPARLPPWRAWAGNCVVVALETSEFASSTDDCALSLGLEMETGGYFSLVGPGRRVCSEGLEFGALEANDDLTWHRVEGTSWFHRGDPTPGEPW